MTNKNGNGSYTNGSGKKTEDDKIVRLPTLAERDRMRKEKEKLEKAGQKKSAQPFFKFGNIPPFTKAMVLAFIAVHVIIFLAFDSAQQLQAFYTMGFVPGYFTGSMGGGVPWFAPLGVFSHMFIHGSWFHLLVNTTMLLALAMPFESVNGARTTTIFFFFCGLAGALFYFALSPFSTVPVIGASGGISGLFGAMLIHISSRPEYAAINRRGPWPIIAFWVIFMTGTSMMMGSNIAWQAHLGGFLAGVALQLLRQKGKLKF